MQERRNSSASAMELRFPCINPSIYDIVFNFHSVCIGSGHNTRCPNVWTTELRIRPGMDACQFYLFMQCMEKAVRPFRYPIRHLVRSHSHKIDSWNYCIALKFDRCLSSTAAEMPITFWSDQSIVNTNLKASRLRRSLYHVLSDSEAASMSLWVMGFNHIVSLHTVIYQIYLYWRYHSNWSINSGR